MAKNIQKYLFNKLFFPKVAIIDKPGVIVNKTVGRFGKEGTKTRVIYIFEDIYSDLYLETVKKLGKEKTDLLWYKIGKDISFRYLLFTKSKKIPKTLLPLVIEHIFDTFSSVGFTFAKDIKYDINKKFFEFTGGNCIICRKSESVIYLMAGVVSGILSSLFNENIEADPQYNNCPKNCKIIANLGIEGKYFPNVEELKPLENYNKNNFPKNNFSIPSEFKSFTDLLKFKKVVIDEKKNFCFEGKTIIPSEAGLPEIFSKNYFEINEIDLLKKIIIKTSEKIIEDILEDTKNVREKIKIVNTIISAFGWGLPYHEKINNKITFKFTYPPITRFGSLFRGLIINGYLNNIYNKRFKIGKLSPYKIEYIS